MCARLGVGDEIGKKREGMVGVEIKFFFWDES